MSTSTTRLFVRPIKVGNLTVKRPLVFYVGLNKVGTAATARLIREHGGAVVAHPGAEGSNVVPLIDPQSKTRKNCRTAYSIAYVAACVKEKKLLDLEEFRLKPSKTPGPKTFQNRLKKRRVRDESVAKHAPQEDEVRRQDGVPKACAQGGTKSLGRQGSNPVLHPRTEKRPTQVAHSPMKGQEKLVHSKEASRSRGNVASANAKWTSAEDKSILELCEDAEMLYRGKKEDPAQTKTLAWWVKVGSADPDLLPRGRAPKECLDRVLELQKSREIYRKRRVSAPNASRMATPAAQQSDSDEDFESNDANDEAEAPIKKQNIPDAHSSTTSPALKPARGESFKNRRERARQKIFRIVRGLSVRGNVSERSAFHALQAENGNWKKALKSILRNNRRENGSQ